MPIPRVLRTLPGYGIFDRGAMNFSRDGSRLFVSCAPLEEIATREKDPAPPVPVPSDRKVQAGFWSWRGDYVQPMQKARAIVVELSNLGAKTQEILRAAIDSWRGGEGDQTPSVHHRESTVKAECGVEVVENSRRGPAMPRPT